MRVKITIAYEGCNYSGFQIQPNAKTVEGVINETLSKILGEDIRIIGASRTDAGVHALGNVAVFDTNSTIPADKFSYVLNQALPKDIVIQKSEEVSENFHPRRENCKKTYEYKILNREFPLPNERRDSYFCSRLLDVDKMQNAANHLIGTHDFKSFCSVKTQTETSVRTIFDIKVIKTQDLITIRVTGNGFLYNMVRIIAGTLINVGTGQMSEMDVQNALEGLDRKLAGPTAPPHALTLVEIKYLTQEAL